MNDLEGRQHSLLENYGQVVVINFWSAECPWSARTDVKLSQLLAELDEDVQLMTIAPNASEPLDMIAPVATERGLDTVLHDVGGHMATVYGAQTTHHIYF